ncbi:MAG TPA: hypothetical protein ENK86_04920 [Campylobacterales bacterium]|nr:hypothetical protein [Campylobacterales bacterium]
MKALWLIAPLLFITACFDNANIKKEPTQDEETTVNITYTPKQQEVKSYLDLYLIQLQNLDTENIIAMTYPKLFIPINKRVFQQYINTLLTSQHISVESFDTEVFTIGSVHPYSHGEFSQISYKSVIKLNFIDPKLYSDDLSVRVLHDVLTRKYGKENITIHPEERSIVISKEEKLLAIKEKGKTWKFLGDNASYRDIYPQILPMDLLAKI